MARSRPVADPLVPTAVAVPNTPFVALLPMAMAPKLPVRRLADADAAHRQAVACAGRPQLAAATAAPSSNPPARKPPRSGIRALRCDKSLAGLAIMASTKRVRELNALDLDKLVRYASTDSTATNPSTVRVEGCLYSIHHRFDDTKLAIGPSVVVVTDVDAAIEFM